jgi:hypothetical protein
MEVDRRVPLVILLRHKNLLDHLSSFSDIVESVNFTVSALEGIKTGKYYINSRGDMVKTHLRGVNVLNTYRVTREDAVVLTKTQYDDFVALIGPGSRV